MPPLNTLDSTSNIGSAWNLAMSDGHVSAEEAKNIVAVLKADGISELVVPNRLFPDAITVESEGAQWTHDAQTERLLVRFSSAGRSSLSLRPSP